MPPKKAAPKTAAKKAAKKASKKKVDKENTPRLDQRDLLLVTDAAIRHRRDAREEPKDAPVNLVHHHLNGYNNFVVNGGIEQIVTDLFSIEQTMINKRDITPEDKKIATIIFQIQFQAVNVLPPQFPDHWTQQLEQFMPNLARERDLTYDAEITVDAKIIAKAFDKHKNKIGEKEEEILNHPIARIPVMVRSKVCNTYNMHHEQLLQHKEDPYDSGGYFIINGTLWLIKNMESVKFNEPRLFLNIGHKNEVCRCEFLSRPGNRFENSAQLILRLTSNGNLSCEITIDKSVNKFKEVYIPFFLIFRVLGITTDLEILKYIVYTDKGNTSAQMLEILSQAFSTKYSHFEGSVHIRSQNDVIKLIYDKTKTQSKKDAIDEATDDIIASQLAYILSIFDKNFLPHIGVEPEDRDRKARFLGYLYHEMMLLLIQPGIVNSTDRDALDTKRIADAGTSYTKVFKKYFNAAMVQPCRNRFKADFRSVSFEQVNLTNSFETAIREVDLTKALRQSIISGAKTVTVKQQQLTYRLTSQQLHQKNQLNVISALRGIETPGSSSTKKDVRSDEMRRVHPSFIGFVCFIQSADSGERVGMDKQMALAATLTDIGSKEILRDILLADSKYPVIPLDSVPSEDIESDKKYAKVFVNGDWIGFIQHSPSFLEYWRNQRRKQKIHKHTGISYKSYRDHIYFDVDYGRLIAPFLIVDRVNGVQDIRLTREHVNQLLLKEIDIEFLVDHEIVEYITPEERLDCLVAESYDVLWENRESTLLDYTHCEIPQAILGMPALTSPYANHNQAPRNVFQTNQVKQTCGWFALNWYDKIEKNTVMQYRNEMPLVRTLANKYMLPNGSNVYLVYMAYSGFNQEDSWIFNQTSLDSGLFLGEHFNLERAELENDNEVFGVPNQSTKELQRNYCYKKLDEKGFIKQGSIIQKDDVLIGKMLKINKSAGPYTHIDKSIVYKYDEPAYVLRVITGRNAKDRSFCKVIYSALRMPVIGDKFCLLPNTEVLTTNGWIPIKNVTVKHKVATLTDGRYIKYENPKEVHKFQHEGNMYSLRSEQVDLTTTLNHKMYVQCEHIYYDLIEARNMMGKKARFLKNAINSNKTVEYIDVGPFQFRMDSWLKFLCAFILRGCVVGHKIQISIHRDDKYKYLEEAAADLGFHVSSYFNTKDNRKYYTIYNSTLAEYLRPYTGKKSDRKLPEYVWNLSQRQSRFLLDCIIKFNGRRSRTKNPSITTTSQMADDVCRLAIHAGYCGNKSMTRRSRNLKNINTYWKVDIIKNKCNPYINQDHAGQQSETIIQYSGDVHCITVSSHVFMVRENGKPVWTGNSARSGQKGVIGMTFTRADMPVTAKGITPDIIMNPHAMPTRMTINQSIEMMVSKHCAHRGIITDGTCFTKVDIDKVNEDLKAAGFDEWGEDRMFNGQTGQWINVKIYSGFCYYQRLQKFTIDELTSSSSSMTCILTRQPVGGRSKKGGLRIGEMEKDVLCSAGSMIFLLAKLIKDSDAYQMYVCRNCGKLPLVNVEEQIYICHTCGDNSDIAMVRTKWSSKLFLQELEGMGIGIRLFLRPFTYETYEVPQ